jgi:tRNA-uridine 2-sulfurtransferase
MRVLVAMSGGVDSSVAAYLLKKQGYEVIGATIKTWSSDECRDERAKGCCSLKDLDDARSVAGKLDIPYYVLNLSDHFKETVIDNFVSTYLEGKTPNPCIQCNHHVKFGSFLNKARELKADHIATGHYARKIYDEKTGRWCIQKGKDDSKDQSYVLFGMSQEQIKKALFPVGDFDKLQIRQLAKELGLRTFDKPDSQEICFVPKHYSSLLEKHQKSKEGPLTDTEGNAMGTHPGYYHFTIGQRKGIKVTDPTPYYVVDILPIENRVVIGKEEDLFKKSVYIEKINWLKEPESKRCMVKIRYKHHPAPGTITREGDGARFVFDEPQKAPCPGQAAVFYEGDTVIGGGYIQTQHLSQKMAV